MLSGLQVQSNLIHTTTASLQHVNSGCVATGDVIKTINKRCHLPIGFISGNYVCFPVMFIARNGRLELGPLLTVVTA